MNKKHITAAFILMLVLFAFLLLLYFGTGKKADVKEKKPSFSLTEEDILNELPMSATVYENDTKATNIAYRIWFDFINLLKEKGKISSAYYTRFHLLDGNDEEFEGAVVFSVELGEKVQNTNWGNVNDNRFITDLVWKLNIKKIENMTYSLENVEILEDKMIGLPPVQDLESYKQEAGIKDTTELYLYTLGDEGLSVSYDRGISWINVPVAAEELFQGDYNGPKHSLIEGSYFISPEKTAFIVGGNHDIRLILSNDKGQTWKEILISDELEGIRMRLLGFTSNESGYFITSGYRTMTSEGNWIFKTNDGGLSWENVGSVTDTTSLVTGGGFINNDIGFVSFGSLNIENEPPIPRLYRTEDGGSTWEQVTIPIPDEYKGYFTVAETPVFNGEKTILLINQGPNGDYLGGKVLAKYTSNDMGATWTFAGLVDPDKILLD